MTIAAGRPAVGMIGLGAIGLAAAERLLGAGFPVAGFRRGSTEAFTRAGGMALPSAAAVAEGTDVLILLLPNDAALAEVMAQITPALRPNQVVVCLGTHLVTAKQQAAAMAATLQATLLDGEISGTPGMLRAGKASILLAGDPAAAERASPVLQALVPSVAYVGAFGNAVRLKLVTNYLVGVHTLAAADALSLAQRLGLEPGMVVDALTASAGGSVMMSVRGRMMAERRYPDGDMLSFVRYFDLLRHALADTRPAGGVLLDVTEAAYRRAIAHGYGGRDIAAICESLADASSQPEPSPAGV